MSEAQSGPLKVVVAGAGLAGALAARVLREKHNVAIYERNADATDSGAATSVGPNGPAKVFNKEGKMVLSKFKNYADEYGADWLFQHRADLRDEFLRLATADPDASGIPGRPARVLWSSKVTSVDSENGRVFLESGGGSRGRSPADGIKSRPVCLSMVYAFDGSMRSVVMYPCRDFQLLNFVCITPDARLKNRSVESWSASGDKEELLDIFSDFPDWVLGHLGMADRIRLWQLRDRDPLPTYARGRAVLVGDAAHAMTPRQGQGGTQAVEDADGFRLFLRDVVSREDVPSILQDFDSVRRPRASTIQQNTRKAMDKRTAEEVYMYEKG
ncbi:FAD/NAD(P)-binding domain-containing protein [Colletotrichum somersetense]|nr:FAD/NAD(P)-binding domain-containing protein [Colletotrichum somersetense]